MDHSESSLPYGVFWFGMLMFAIGVIGTCAGQIWGRNGRKVYRCKDPKVFWLGVASYYLAGIGLVGYYLYKAGVFSN